MTKEHKSGATDEYIKLAAVGLIALIVGLLIGPMIMPAQPTVENKTEVFTPNMQKINEIKQIFEDYYYLQTGERTSLSYSSAKEMDGIIQITYTSADLPQPLQIYASSNYQYLIPNVISLTDLKNSIEAAKKELDSASQPQEMQKSEKPDVKLYIMSFCPYGNVAEQAFNSVIHTLGDSFEFEPIYIIYDETVSPQYNAQNQNYCMADEQNVAYCSMHGINELKQGIREIAIFRLYGAKTWADYVNAADQKCSLGNIEECWKTVAEEMDLNPAEIEKYYNDHLYEMLADQKQKTFSAKKFGSPSIVINGQDYSGSRTPESFKTAICSAFTALPEGCNATLSQTGPSASGSCG